ncbi:1951_t:CDS:2 [Paraglomus brasilianum]|uniref:1951_t:CDS:1 n=1 Tax=Paraglomus brasilianum TaxID=144538 RepID=A0A9N8ZF15_9GLOM|nr:1951_t:CDS:2 [Paraglomus brasilianum]
MDVHSSSTTTMQSEPKQIPITVFTGFLGAGKTTIILSLIPHLPKDYKLCLLKNEFGDIAVDSELARESNVSVQEMLNGCLCCVLVGQMKNALTELKEKYNPDRIIIETRQVFQRYPNCLRNESPIAWQIREMNSMGFVLDSIATVIDCVNFSGYEDTSYTAKMQAQYTDVILLNKWEMVNEYQLDVVIDHINELNTDTPKIKCCKDSGVSPDIIFGIDTTLFSLSSKSISIDTDLSHHRNEVDLIQIVIPSNITSYDIHSKDTFENFLASLPKDEINEKQRGEGIILKLIFMGELRTHLDKVKKALDVNDQCVKVHYAHR